MAVVTFSSTKPNAYDGHVWAEAKILQIANSKTLAVDVSGTVEFVPTTNDAFDTETSTLEKILQQANTGFGVPGGILTDIAATWNGTDGVPNGDIAFALSWDSSQAGGVAGTTAIEIEQQINGGSWTNVVTLNTIVNQYLYDDAPAGAIMDAGGVVKYRLRYHRGPEIGPWSIEVTAESFI